MVSSTCRGLEACRRGGGRRRPGVQPRGRHGRDGVHREQQGPLHALRADQHAHADGRARRGRRALLLLVVGLRLRRRAPDRPRTSRRSTRRTPIRRCPRTATAGRSSSASGCAATSARTSGWPLAWPATTTSTGPYGTYDGGREKAPAAICRKVIQAKLSGDARDRDLGRRRADAQLHVRRRLRARIPASDLERRDRAPQHRQLRARDDQPAGLDRRGDRRASTLERRYKLDAPQGVRGRNSDNTLILERLGWEPSISLRDGMERTYRWIYDQMVASGRYDTVAASAAR